MRTTIGFLLLPLVIEQGISGDECDPLRCLTSKSDLVIVGEITDDPRYIGIEGVECCLSRVKIRRVLKGDAQKNRVIYFSHWRSTSTAAAILGFPSRPTLKDRSPHLKRGQECILFLKRGRNKPPWETADRWFGVQPGNDTMANSIAWMVKNKGRSCCCVGNDDPSR